MSCIGLVAQPHFPIVPILFKEFEALRDSGRDAIVRRFAPTDAELKSQSQRIGAVTRCDGKPFYLTTLAPDGDSVNPPWSGSFFADFAFMEITGIVRAKLDVANNVRLDVSAQLTIDADNIHVDAAWTVIGASPATTGHNRAAIIANVIVNNPGPHSADAIKACIARHAPERALGTAHEVVALQCGVAVSCLIEAIC